MSKETIIIIIKWNLNDW